MDNTLNWLKSNVLLLLILVLSVALRLYHINFQSLWLDEIHTVNEANPALTLGDLYTILCEADPHPPLYFLITKGAFLLFGYTEVTVRVTAALLGVAGVWAIYLLGRELYGKQAGLVSAALASVNSFHIYYSQDARPYPLLFLCTTLSFYYLVKFVKSPSVKQAFLYGIFTALMLYSHLFSLFGLCAQGVVLLYFIVKPFNNVITVKKMFIQCLISAAVIVVMYLPCLKIFLSAAQRTSFWIEKPKPDAYIELLEEFFGNYEVLTAFVVVAFLLFLVGMFIESRKKSQASAIMLSGIVLLTWLLVTLIIPLIKSYIGVSIIISRYFINVLPAVILLVAIGIIQLKNKFAVYGITVIMALLSLYNIFSLKNYYTTVNKTQFREALTFVCQHNNNHNTHLVTSLGWYMPFYLEQNKRDNYQITERSLEDYVNDMDVNNVTTESFWYLDAHNRPYKPSEKTKQFLEANFEVKESYEGYDIWTKHYVALKNIKTEIAGVGSFDAGNNEQINYHVENFEKNGDVITIKGWAFFPDVHASQSKIKVCLIQNTKATILPTIMAKREDVTYNLKPKFNADNSGFKCTYTTDTLKPGRYHLGLYLENSQNNKKGLAITNKFFVKN